MSPDTRPDPEHCPEPFWHKTHRYCPACTWTEPPQPTAAMDYAPSPCYGVVDEVLAERLVQMDRWGNIHDDNHAPHDWLALIQQRQGRAAFAGDQFRRQMIVTAALAVAAVEWFDRTAGRVRLARTLNNPFVDYERWDAWIASAVSREER